MKTGIQINFALWGMIFCLVMMLSGPAQAQWQVDNHAVPVGRGVGIQGFKQAAPGVVGKVLTSNGASSDPTFQASTNAALQATPSDPSTTTSTTGVMMGLGSSCTITPVSSSKVRISWEGNIANTASTNSAFTIMRYGTGSAPANAAAATGTILGKTTGIFHGNPSASVNYAFSRSGVITGLTPGTAYWFDLQLGVVTSGTVGLFNLACSANEF